MNKFIPFDIAKCHIEDAEYAVPKLEEAKDLDENDEELYELMIELQDRYLSQPRAEGTPAFNEKMDKAFKEKDYDTIINEYRKVHKW